MEINKAVNSSTIIASTSENVIAENSQIPNEEPLNIYHVAHDLKGLITKISGLNSLLKLNLNDNSNPEISDISDLFETICLQGDHMINDFIFNNTLNQPKDYQLSYSSVLLNDVIKGQSIIHQLLARKKEIELEITIPDEKIHCFINGEDFKRVIDNLLSNAVKFTPRKGTIQIELNVHEDNAIIEIVDSGIGISIDLQKELFLPHSKVQRLGTENEPSTGLGLTIVKKIIEMNKGAITLSSIEGVGTSISIQFKRTK